ncbi:unnamed protein product [Camellia sinensis]
MQCKRIQSNWRLQEQKGPSIHLPSIYPISLNHLPKVSFSAHVSCCLQSLFLRFAYPALLLPDLLKEVEQLLGLEERDILQQNATPNLGKISTVKWNPFHSLGLAGQIHYMDMLLGNGLHIDLADKDGMTALHTAIIGKKELSLDGASPLHYAVQVGGMQTVKLLIKYNVDVNASDNEGWTPLHIAIQTRNRDIAKVLLVNGADKTRRNKESGSDIITSLCFTMEKHPLI